MTLTDGTKIPARILVWTAGVKASGITNRFGVDVTGSGRVRSKVALQLPGHPEVDVVSDAAYLEGEKGGSLPVL